MEKYSVRMTARALRDLDAIYEYIAKSILIPETAISLVEEIETGINSLESMPQRCPERRVGNYANKGYRQLFIRHYTVVFRIDEQGKQVVVVTIRYSPSLF